MWNNFISSFFRTDVGVGQGFTLSLILSALYISPIFHIFEKRSKNHIPNISPLFLSFVDDGLFISQKKTYEKSNAFLFCSYNIITSLFNQFSLIIEHGKLEFFYFSKLTRNFNSLPLDLTPWRGLLLQLKNTWKYFSFIFDRKLSFWQHIWFYSNKALSTIKEMEILGNSTRGLSLHHKQLLYGTCILPIMLYRFPL